MRTRLAQILARFIAIALFWVAGAIFGDISTDTAAELSAYSDAIGVALAGVLVLGVDMFLHRLQTGSVLKTVEVPKKK